MARRLISAAALFVVAVFIAVQFIPVERINPPASPEDAISAPPQVKAILRHACYECHSNETRWPWYSHVAPISWLIAHDVVRARREVNFSEWGSYYPATRRRKLEWMGRELREGNMPPWDYLLMHPSARLSRTDRAALQRWIESAPATPATGQSLK